MNKSASAQDFEQKILNLVKNRNYNNFIKAPAVAGATIGGVGGGLAGLGETYVKSHDFDNDHSHGEAQLNDYLSNALKRGVQGAAVGGGVGVLRGAVMKEDLIKNQMNEVKNKLGKPGIFGRGAAHNDRAKALWEDMVTSGKLNDVDVIEHLAKQDNPVEKAMATVLKPLGNKVKSPEEMLASRQQLEQKLKKFMDSGDLKYVEQAGLSDAEKELVKHKYDTRADLAPVVEALGKNRSSIAPVPGVDTVLTMKRKALEQTEKNLANAAANPYEASEGYNNINKEMQRVQKMDEVNRVHAELRQAVNNGDTAKAGRLAKKVEQLMDEYNGKSKGINPFVLGGIGLGGAGLAAAAYNKYKEKEDKNKK
jgi:hypothetical protein